MRIVKHVVRALTNNVIAAYTFISVARNDTRCTMPRVENRFEELLAEKRRQDRKNWSYREIAEVTGISPSTLTRFARQRHEQFDAGTLAKLCEFLGCTVGDLLVLVKDEAPLGQRVAVA